MVNIHLKYRPITTRKSEKTNGITDGLNSVSKSVGIYRRTNSVGDTVGIYRWNMSVGIYRPYLRRTIHFVRKNAMVWWRGAFSDDFIDGMYPSVIPSVKTIIYTPSADILFLCFSFFFFPIPPLPSQTAANHLSQLSTILNTSTQVSYTLYVVTISVSCGFYHFFVSKSILFSFNI